jgi:hypothetical protein
MGCINVRSPSKRQLRILLPGGRRRRVLSGVGSDPGTFGRARCCDSKIAKLRAILTPGLRLDHKIGRWYGYAPFQSVRNKFKDDLRI